MNAELVNQALVKVPNPNDLVNLGSRGVRQLTGGGGAASRALVDNVAHLDAADTASREIIEDKMKFEMPKTAELTRPTGKNRKCPKDWTRG